MAHIIDLVTEDFIEKNTIPSNYSYSKAMYERSAIEFIEQKPGFVQAWAGGLDGSVKEGGGSRRRVTFTAEKNELHWSCSGNPKDHQIFCKHCVAVALALKSSKSVA